MMPCLRPVTVTMVVLAAVGCGGTPAAPSDSPRDFPLLLPYCHASGSNVVCTASMFNVPGEADHDVTASATWSATPPALASFASPGTLVPVAHGEVQVAVRYQSWSGGYEPGYLVGPGENARFLSSLAMTVTEVDKKTAISGAVVSMLSGYRSGAVCVTNSIGFCAIDRVLDGETFSAQVTKTGYQPVTFEYRVDQFGNTPSYFVSLSRVP